MTTEMELPNIVEPNWTVSITKVETKQNISANDNNIMKKKNKNESKDNSIEFNTNVVQSNKESVTKFSKAQPKVHNKLNVFNNNKKPNSIASLTALSGNTTTAIKPVASVTRFLEGGTSTLDPRTHNQNKKKKGGYNYMVIGFSSAFERIKRSVRWKVLYAILGIITEVIQRELKFECSDSCENAIKVLQMFTTITTIGLLYNLYLYHKWSFSLQALDRQFLRHAPVWTTDRIKLFIVEALILSIHTPMNLSVMVDISVKGGPDAELENPWSILIFIRLYLLYRLVSTHLYTGGSRIVGMWHNFNFNSAFVVRNVLHSYPFFVLVPALICLSILFSYLMMICERDVDSSNSTIPNSFDNYLWLTYITMTAVGYGDMYPVTSCGRGVAIISAICAIIITSVLVATIYENLSLRPQESRMIEFLERVSRRKKLETLACIAIQRARRLQVLRRNGESSILKTIRIINLRQQVADALSRFQVYRKQSVSLETSMNNFQFTRCLLEDVDDKLTALFVKYFKIDDLDNPEAKPIDIEALGELKVMLEQLSKKAGVIYNPDNITKNHDTLQKDAKNKSSYQSSSQINKTHDDGTSLSTKRNSLSAKGNSLSNVRYHGIDPRSRARSSRRMSLVDSANAAIQANITHLEHELAQRMLEVNQKLETLTSNKS